MPNVTKTVIFLTFLTKLFVDNLTVRIYYNISSLCNYRYTQMTTKQEDVKIYDPRRKNL